MKKRFSRLKRSIFALVCVVVCLSVSVVPSFAILSEENGWSGGVRIEKPFQPSENGISYNDIQEYTALVDDAFALGLFGGSYPVAIANYNGEIQVFCAPSVQIGAQDVARLNGSYLDLATENDRYFTNPYYSESYEYIAIVYALGETGAWVCRGVTNAPKGATGVIRLLAARLEAYSSTWTTAAGQEGFAVPVVGMVDSNILPIRQRYRLWLAPPEEGTYDEGYQAGYDEGYSSGVADGATGENEAIYEQGYVAGITDGYNSGYDAGYNSGYTVGYDEGYDVGLDDGASISENVTLDIPGIFDGMFAGVRSIFSSVDIEIFGINILGTLVAVLVIVLVGFIVRKLWK